MNNFGKVGFDPGHFKGQNIGPNGYIEGNVMLQLGLMLQEKYGSFITRADEYDVSFQDRAKKAKQAGCNTLISLHTNAPIEAKGILIFYSMHRPGDKAMAEYIGKELAKATGIDFRAAKTRPSISFPDQDYYGMIRRPIDAGIEHVFIIEHGSHWEMAVNTSDKLKKIVECYGRILGLTPKQPAINEAIDIWAKVGIILDPAGMKNDFATGSFRPDRYSAFMIKSANYIKERVK